MKVYIVGEYLNTDEQEDNPPIVVRKVFASKQLASDYIDSYSIYRKLWGDHFIVIGEEVLSER